MLINIHVQQYGNPLVSKHRPFRSWGAVRAESVDVQQLWNAESAENTGQGSVDIARSGLRMASAVLPARKYISISAWTAVY